MNWLGEIIQRHVRYDQTVLDLGCGIMQATTDSMTKTRKNNRFGISLHVQMPDVLRCKSLLGCEIVDKYLEKAKYYYPVIKFDLTKEKSFDIFKDRSFDVVIALDVLEHFDFQTTLRIIGKMERIARKKIIIYTPSKWITNEENIEDAWGLGNNPCQKHLCFVPPSRFKDWGYKVSFPEPDKNTLAIKVKR